MDRFIVKKPSADQQSRASTPSKALKKDSVTAAKPLGLTSKPGAVNAFAKLMQPAEESKPEHVFRLMPSTTGVDTSVRAMNDSTSSFGDWSACVSIKDPLVSRSKVLIQLQHAKDNSSSGIPGFATYAAQCLSAFGRLSPSMMKSIIQKSVRRRKPEAAVPMACALMHKSFTEFIRRIMIIAVEDTMPSPDYPFLAWLLLADSKGYTPTEVERFHCLRVVREMCVFPYWDRAWQNTERPPALSSVLSLLKEENGEQVPLMTLALLIRASFGGMAFDQRLLKQQAFQWYLRETQKLAPPSVDGAEVRDWKLFWAENAKGQGGQGSGNSEGQASKRQRITTEETKAGGEQLTSPASVKEPLPPPTAASIPLAGIDFHCSNVVDAVMKFPETRVFKQRHGLSEEEVADSLKSAMWTCSSGVNTRKPWTKFEGRTPEEAMKSLPLDVQQQLGLWKHFAPVVQRVVVNILKGRIQDVP